MLICLYAITVETVRPDIRILQVSSDVSTSIVFLCALASHLRAKLCCLRAAMLLSVVVTSSQAASNSKKQQ
jgi:hypothetical protein